MSLPEQGAVSLPEQGFVVLEGLLDDAALAAARAHADDLLADVAWSDNDFDGRHTRRVYSLLNRLGAFELLLTQPVIHRYVHDALGDVYQFGMLVLSAVDPGQGAQMKHFDAGVYPLPRDLEVEINTIWALDDFTADNGATMIAPGSHAWPKERRPSADEMVPVVMPAGSVLIYSGRLWHHAGENRSEATRRALICEHIAPWLRPGDNHILATGVDGLAKLSPELRRLAGVAAASTYLGFVGGEDPEQWFVTHHTD